MWFQQVCNFNLSLSKLRYCIVYNEERSYKDQESANPMTSQPTCILRDLVFKSLLGEQQTILLLKFFCNDISFMDGKFSHPDFWQCRCCSKIAVKLASCGCLSEIPCSRITCSCRAGRLSYSSYCRCRADGHCGNVLTKKTSSSVVAAELRTLYIRVAFRAPTVFLQQNSVCTYSG